MFFTVANVTYSKEEKSGVVQGLSSSTPIEYNVRFFANPNGDLTVHNLCEFGYDLTVRAGVVRYEEQKSCSQSVY